MQTDTKHLETYDRIIQNLFTLKEEAIETKIKETDAKQLEAYERIILNLFTLKEEAKETKHQAISSRSDRGYIVHAVRPIRVSAWPQFINVFYYPQN